MFVFLKQADKANQVIATLLAVALVLATLGYYHTAQAANLTDVSNTLTDSSPGAQSGHEIRFSIPPNGNTLENNDEITITFPDDFTGVDLLEASDLTVEVIGAGTAGIVGLISSGQDVSFQLGDQTAATGTEIVVTIDAGVVSNPSTVDVPALLTDSVSFEFMITTPDDVGYTRVVILPTVQVTAVIKTVFEFTVSGLASTSADVNGEELTLDSSTTSIPFGVLTAGQPETIGQRLRVTSNAINGFVVTVEQDGDLRSETGAVISSFIEGAYTNTPTAWPASLSNQIEDSNTWGHWGLTTNDATLNSYVSDSDFNVIGGGDRWVAASTTPRAIFAHNGPADGNEPNIGSVDVAYKIEITPLQEAADDYQTTLMYIATPTF